ncbi:OmpA family protein [Haematospirillum jordaniae]|uniref:flagellar motor protein MotB n=1 Tax=Haematospirillum jordaniae TaxID=1549855 RepID=UPI0014333B1A|nr:flagellar motor protein MotB [Haematospirillum jordaniae]NKD84798.1 OmpA family protein [Haematospirillum jordaniae]
MAEEEGKNAIIIKRIKKGGHAAHGGAWKVAYADFVTAMMAFFLLLWLLNSVTEEQLQGISNYFAPTAVSQSPSGAGGMLGGLVVGEGASQSNSAPPATNINLPPSTVGSGGQDFTDPQEGRSEKDQDSSAEQKQQQSKEEDARRQREQLQLDTISREIRQALNALPQMKALQDSLIIDNTPEGLRIQLIDQDRLPMFPAGSSALYEHTQKLLLLVSRVVKLMPQKIAVSGHADSGGFTDPSGYGSWELSADRALAARRVLLQGGVPDDRFARIAGVGPNDPLEPSNPDSPRNRRISIVLLRDDSAIPADSGNPGSSGSGPLPSILDTR